ncbi:MAG: macro domain-containing protein [Bacilli bacterium]|jgi:O-acetyl-ADP-ribose deacetylase (regulator of RNase III)|nr:macro domain-containing protein [Bacilli bacterium]
MIIKESTIDLKNYNVEAIVNFDNNNLSMNDGISYQIYKTAGALEMSNTLKQCIPLNDYELFLSAAYHLKANSIIHMALPDNNILEPIKAIKEILLKLMNYVIDNKIKSILIPCTKDSKIKDYLIYLDDTIIPTLEKYKRLYNIEITILVD